MAETPYNHYALYGPDASPDLTATGEYNRAVMGIDSDMHAEETERAHADKQLSDRITTLGNQEIADVRDLNAKILAEEMNRVSADSGLATDIDNEKKARTNYDALIEREYKTADAKLTADLAAETAERKTDTQAAREERTRIEREYKAADSKMDERITALNNQEIADIRDVNAKLAQEVTDRKAADTALDTKITGGLNNVTNGLTTVGNAISKVEADYKAADVALGKRIDNAEGEISANSADLTGIKGLTYGGTHVSFIENSNGEYSSPALEEIAEEVDALKAVPPYTLPVASSNTLGGVKIPNDSEIGIGNNGIIYLTKNIPDKIQVQHTPGSDYVDINLETGVLEFNGAAFSLKAGNYGSAIVGLNLPFSTIGTGLKVVDDALTVDTQALPSALTIMQLSEFGELTPSTGIPYSATGNGNAAAYAKLAQAWPSVIVVDGGTTWMGGMYTPVRYAQSGYRLVKSAGIDDNAIQMTIHGSGYSGAITLGEIGG